MAKKVRIYNPFGKVLGLKVDEAGDGRCLGHLEVNDSLYNPHMVVHGGVLFSLADTTMGAALYTLLDEWESCATIEIKINFLRPVVQGRLSCESVVVRRGRNTAVLESKLHLGDSLVALAVGTYAVFKKETG